MNLAVLYFDTAHCHEGKKLSEDCLPPAHIYLLAQLQASPAYDNFHMKLIISYLDMRHIITLVILYLDPIKTFLNKQSMLAIATESHMLATKMPVCLCENEMLLEWRHISKFERSPNKLQDPSRLFYADRICSRRQEYESLL